MRYYLFSLLDLNFSINLKSIVNREPRREPQTTNEILYGLTPARSFARNTAREYGETETLEIPTPTKNCSSPMRNKTINRASSKKHVSLRRSNEKLRKPNNQQENPKAQLRHKNLTARAQQNLSLSPPRPQKLRKPNRTPRMPNSNKN